MKAILIYLACELSIGVILALLLRRFVCALVLVKGRSMMDTLQNHELMLALRYGLFGRPRRFDVVICKYPNRKQLFVKRIIGMPGERISMEEGRVYISGEELEENFQKRHCMCSFDEVILGENEYFVMGDNRPCSVDSRKVGPIKEDMLLGRAKCVIFPLKRRRRIDK